MQESGFELGFVLGWAIVLGALAWRAFFRVEEGHRGVLVAFGAAKTNAARQLVTFGPGLHLKKPWERVISVSLKEQTLDLNREEGGSTAMTDDGTVLRLDAFVRYAPLEKDLAHFLFGLEHPTEHITGLFTCLLRNEIANVGSGDSESGYVLVRRQRALLSERIASFCQERIGDRYGIGFNAVDLVDILPPDELADALNAVVQAESEALSRVHRAEAECQQRVLSAERGVAIATLRAEAIETEIRGLWPFLDDLDRQGVLDAYVARRRAEVTSEARTLFVKEVAT